MEEFYTEDAKSLQNGESNGEERAGVGKLESGMAQLIAAETWSSISSSGLAKKAPPPVMTVPASPLATPAMDHPGGLALKMAAAVLQPICFGDGPVVLPIHLQMAGGVATPQVGPAGVTPYLMTGGGPMSLPLVLEQQLFQHLNSQLLPQVAPCPALSLQNSLLCQNKAVTFCQPALLEQKPAVLAAQEPGLIPMFQNPGLAAVLHDLFPSQNNFGPSACHAAGANPADPFSAAFLPPPPSHAYSSPLAPLVPPPTLMVPYPVIVPLPVPLPIPIPIPVPQSAEAKAFANSPEAACTQSKSTQTYTEEFPSPVHSHGRDFTQHSISSPSSSSSSSSLSAAEGEALDLSVRATPVQPKQEVPFIQDTVLDLSVARTPCIQSRGRGDPPANERLAWDVANPALSVEVMQPVECPPMLDPRLLSGLTSLDFSRQHRWVVDGGRGGWSGQKTKYGGGGNFEIVSTSQTAKVIVAVKDVIPAAIFCGKLKSRSGVSARNSTARPDASRDAARQQCCGTPPRAQVEPPDLGDPCRNIPKSRAVKLKKVSSQEIHILPIKKQRLAALFPRK